MSEAAIKALSDTISEAHARIQQKHANLNPVVEVRRGMRDAGIPADVLTIDCLASRQRILLVLHDEKPGVLMYQFMTMEQEMGVDFQQMRVVDLSVDLLIEWVEGWFLKSQTQ